MNLINPLDHSKKEWLLVYFIYDAYNKNNYTNQIFRLSIESFKLIFNLKEIIVYTSVDKIDSLKSLSKEYNLKVYGSTTSFPGKMNIILQSMKENNNLILTNPSIVFDYHNYLPKNQLINIDSNKQIYSIFKSIYESNDFYWKICSKCNLEKIIDSNLLIVPFNQSNKEFIVEAYQIATQIKTQNDNLITEIALSLTNKKVSFIGNKNNFISDIKESNLFEKIKFVFPDKPMINVIKELQVKNKNIDWIEWLNGFDKYQVVPNNYCDYIYYPNLDVDFGCTKTSLIKRVNQNELPFSFNTNGYFIDSLKRNQIQKLLFHRFDSTLNGLFIKKENQICLPIEPIIKEPLTIPKIFHQLWLESDVLSNDCIYAWQRVLKRSWGYRLWTITELRLEVFKPNANGLNRWEKLFNLELDVQTKVLIAQFAILEKYGGIVIDGLSIPLNVIPDEILNNHFIIGFLDENLTGTTLSYRLMGSSHPMGLYQLKYDLFNEIYQLIAGNHCSLLNDLLISHPYVTVYPSYYFNKRLDDNFRSLNNLTICAMQWKPLLPINQSIEVINTKLIPTSITRKNIVATMILNLSENPYHN